MQKLTQFKDFTVGDTVRVRAGIYGATWDNRTGEVVNIIVFPDFEESNITTIQVRFTERIYGQFDSVPDGIDENVMLFDWRNLSKDVEPIQEIKAETKKIADKTLSAIEKARRYARLGTPQEPIEGF